MKGRTIGSSSTSIVVVCRRTKVGQSIQENPGRHYCMGAHMDTQMLIHAVLLPTAPQSQWQTLKEVMHPERVLLLLLFAAPPFPLLLLLLSVKHTQP